MKRDNTSFSGARSIWWIRRVVLPGFLIMLLGYAVSYYSNAQTLHFTMAGRGTRFSLAALLGSCIVVTAIPYFLLTLVRERIWKATIAIGSAEVLSLLSIYSFVIQDDYLREWAHDRTLLSQTMALSPDVTTNTLFILRRSWTWVPPFLRTPRLPAINSQPHGIETSLKYLFNQRNGPKIFLVYSDAWKQSLAVQADGKVHWTKVNFDISSPRDLAEPVGPVITLVEESNGCVRRVEDPVFVDGRQIVQLSDHLRRDEASSNWKKFEASPLVPLVVNKAGGCSAPNP